MEDDSDGGATELPTDCVREGVLDRALLGLALGLGHMLQAPKSTRDPSPQYALDFPHHPYLVMVERERGGKAGEGSGRGVQGGRELIGGCKAGES